MAYPFVMFDNVFEDGTMTTTRTFDATNPPSHVTDWRIGTAARWKADVTTSGNHLECDLDPLAAGGLDQSATCGIFSGHNLSQAIDSGATGNYTWQYSDDGIAWTNAHSAKEPTTDLPIVETWTHSTAHQYWRLRIQNSGGFVVAPQIGHAICGVQLSFSELLQASFSAYDISVDTEESVSENGDFIGSNVNRVDKMFNLSWDAPGLTEADFFNPASGLTFDGDFVTHAVNNGKPFYFVWDYDEAPNEVWICRCRGFQSPHMDTTTRRRLFMSFHGWREVA